jgi:hypothetical protein
MPTRDEFVAAGLSGLHHATIERGGTVLPTHHPTEAATTTTTTTTTIDNQPFFIETNRSGLAGAVLTIALRDMSADATRLLVVLRVARAASWGDARLHR